MEMAITVRGLVKKDAISGLNMFSFVVTVDWAAASMQVATSSK